MTTANATSASTTTTTPPAPATEWPVQRLNLPAGGSYATLGGSLYVDPENTTPTPTEESVVRIDAQTGQIVAKSAALPTGSLAAAGQTLWLAPQPTPAGQRLRVIELNPVSLTGPGDVALPGVSTGPNGPPLVLAGNPAGTLWAAYGNHLYKIDTARAAVVAQATANNQIVGLALDNQARLYDSLNIQSPQTPPQIEQRSSTTGSLVASANNSSVAGAALVATSTGVWASYRTGLQGASTRYAADTLTVNRPAQAPYFAGGMDVYTTLAGGVLWVTTITNLTCADPDTGAVRASEPSANGYPPIVVAVVASHVFAVDTAGLSIIKPPTPCGI